jgi:hypothetical protein
MKIKVSNNYSYGFFSTVANFIPEAGDVYTDIINQAEALKKSLREAQLEASYSTSQGTVYVTLQGGQNIEKAWTGDGWYPTMAAVETQMDILQDHIHRVVVPVRKANIWITDVEPDYDEQEE